MKRYLQWTWARPALFLPALAALLTMAMEILSRRSLPDALSFLFTRPVPFFCNTLCVLFTLSFCLLFQRRIFVLSFLSALWLGLAIADFVLLSFRSAPLSAIDFYLLFAAFRILEVYLTPWQIALVIAAFAGTFAALAFLFWKAPRSKALYKTGLLILSVSGTALILCHFAVQSRSGPDSFADLPRAYDDYGFVYCFSTSLLDTGIQKPKEYTDEKIHQLADTIKEEWEEEPSSPQQESPAETGKPRRPNIIMVQLESFIDPGRLAQVAYSREPAPIFRSLKERFSTGSLTVPSVGGGTANTEFEVLTGMSLDYFGPGEYPYQTILQQSTCESIAYILREQGYGTHAIHNNAGTFYDRHLVFPHLGFDRFTPLEYMNHVTYNPIGWAKDSILTTEILESLLSTEGEDFVYAISVQAHGKYPSRPLEGAEQAVTVHADGLTEEDLAAYSYYVNQIREVDAFLQELIDILTALGEPAILVFYGDHLPSLAATELFLPPEEQFQTEYAIWDNLGLVKKDQDLFTYQLGARLLELAGIEGGVLPGFHRAFADNPHYQEYLEMLEYDMLYGKQTAYPTGAPAPVPMRMGPEPILADSVYYLGSELYLLGEGFTPYSRILINGEPQPTEHIFSGAIKATLPKPGEAVLVSAAQVGEDGVPLGATNEIWFTPEEEG